MSDHNMTSFRDFLMWGLLSLPSNLWRLFLSIKTSTFLRPLSRYLRFQAAKEQNVNFALFDKRITDLYEEGSSIFFTRHHCGRNIRIRSDKTDGSVVLLMPTLCIYKLYEKTCLWNRSCVDATNIISGLKYVTNTY